MKLGIDTYSYHIALAAGEFDLFAALGRMEELGLEGLQININGPNGRFLGGDPTDRDHVRKVGRALAARGFFAEIGGKGTAPAELEWQLRLAAELGADVLRTLLVFSEPLVVTFERTSRDLEAVLPLARELGVRIAFENHEDVTAGELRAFLDQVGDDQVGACCDTGNDLVVYGDPLDGARQLAPRAITTHIKDHQRIRVGGVVYSVGVPLGQGELPVARQVAEIVRNGSLDRLLLQDTTGYSSRLNPFERRDLHPGADEPVLPEFPDPVAAAASGYLLSLDSLDSGELRRIAGQTDERIRSDMHFLRRLLTDLAAP